MNLVKIVSGTAVLSLACCSVVVGQTWVQTSAPVLSWQGVASSADGNRLAAVASEGIFTSTNAGFTWTPANAPTQTWLSVASSADGTKLVAGTFDSKVYLSTNSGLQWSSNMALGQFRVALASTPDGSKLAAAYTGGQIFLSTNSGQTWTQANAPSSFWTGIASSADGTKLVAVGDDIYVSTNGGSTWTITTAPHLTWQGVASSADGTRLVAGTYAGPTYLSADSGASWQSNSVMTYVDAAASSADGTKLVVGTGFPYISRDGGATWSRNGAPGGYWTSVASSADGAKLVAVARGGGIYVWQVPSLTISLSTEIVSSQHGKPTTFTNKIAVISWPTNLAAFTLQQNSNLTTANWTIVTNSPVVTNGQTQVTLPVPTAGFYRLRIP